MSREDLQPGKIWPGTELSSLVLMEQWAVEFRHQGNKAEQAHIVFTDSGWEDLEWNAREALHLNTGLARAPTLWRHLFLPQEGINTHLLRSLHMILNAWQQWIQLPHVRVINGLPGATECRMLLKQARGRLESAQSKQDSLVSRKQAFQQFSLRQWRFYQQVCAFFNDLDLLVSGSADFAYGQEPSSGIDSMARDILWHSKELLLLLQRPEFKPSQLVRLRAPRLKINKLTGANCLYHAGLLKSLMNFS